MSDTVVYNSWPLGKLPKELQRPEPKRLAKKGYLFTDPREIINIFETNLALFAGSKYCVTVDTCSNALFLCIKYIREKYKHFPDTITIPNRTYISVPMQIIHSGCKVEFEDVEWSGMYQLKPYPIYDAATRFTRGMFIGGNNLQVASFQIKKRLPIGKGGAIFTNDKDAYEWLKLATYDGRDLNTQYMSDEHVKMIGWHYYMTPEDAARGQLILDSFTELDMPDTGGSNNYFDLSTHKLFKK